MRGNPQRDPNRAMRKGSIPAHAGEPCRYFRMVFRRQWVYPRACGGTRGRAPPGPLAQGSIPAHAGEPCHRRTAPVTRHGSIPAHAGEPQHPSARDAGSSRGLSPRMRGNRRASSPRSGSRSEGLSPRMRGNPVARVPPSIPAHAPTIAVGSIPAHAGEPACT